MLRSATQTSLSVLKLTPGATLVNRWQRYVQKRAVKRHLSRGMLIAVNVALLGVVVAVVVLNPSRTGTTSEPVASAVGTVAAARPVDQLASVNIAITVTQMTNLPEAGAITSQANSERIQLAVASSNSEVVNKPQAVSSKFVSNKDIRSYTTVAGDTVSSIASKFGVSSDSILWSNGLTGNNLAVGKTLSIPPVDGIVYTMKNSDTASSLASTYHSDATKIVAYNDSLQPGSQIIIPDGQIIVTAPVYYSSFAAGFAWGGGAVYGYNGYDYGNCTWYVASQIQVPANWGNASTWAAGARAAGWHVSSTPSVGAIAQNSWMAYGLGHVGIVDGVSSDGKQVLIREMNGAGGVDGNGNQVYGGWGRVDVAWQPVSNYPNFITR